MPEVLPNFLCVGAQKSGTTTLHDILIQHPDIYLPELKETKFFVNNTFYNKGIGFYKKKFFSRWNGEKAVGEVDPDYMYFDYVPERIYKTLGKDLKLIFLLRNPVDRAYSNYLMTLRRGYEKYSFEKAIDLEQKRIKKSNFYKLHFSYIDRGYYYKQIKRYLKFFPKENMFFVIFETDFLRERKRTIRKLLKFLNVPDDVELNLNVKSNVASLPKSEFVRDFIYKPDNLQNVIRKIGKLLIPTQTLRIKILKTIDKLNQKPYVFPTLTPEKKQILIKNYFWDDIKKLEQLLNVDLRVWYDM